MKKTPKEVMELTQKFINDGCSLIEARRKANIRYNYRRTALKSRTTAPKLHPCAGK